MQMSIIRLFNGIFIRVYSTRKIRVVNGVDVYIFTGRTKFWFDERFRGLVTGEIIFVDCSRSAYDEELIAHEMEHVKQFRRWKLLFPALYFLELFRVGYMANRFEVAARDASSRL